MKKYLLLNTITLCLSALVQADNLDIALDRSTQRALFVMETYNESTDTQFNTSELGKIVAELEKLVDEDSRIGYLLKNPSSDLQAIDPVFQLVSPVFSNPALRKHYVFNDIDWTLKKDVRLTLIQLIKENLQYLNPIVNPPNQFSKRPPVDSLILNRVIADTLQLAFWLGYSVLESESFKYQYDEAFLIGAAKILNFAQKIYDKKLRQGYIQTLVSSEGFESYHFIGNRFFEVRGDKNSQALLHCIERVLGPIE